MKYLKQVWHYLILEPLSWLFYCFFQPIWFKSEFEINGLWKRIIPMLRLTLPIFLVAYPFVLIGQLTPCGLFLGIDFGCYPSVLDLLQRDSLPRILSIQWNIFLTIAWATILGIAWGILWGILGNMTWGITLAIGLGIVVGIDWGIVGGIVASIVAGIAWGIMGDMAQGSPGGFVSFSPVDWGNSGIFQVAIRGGAEVAFTFMISYFLGYYRLPLYPVSGLSGLRSYLASRNNPPQVFTYLHRSSLYWDERIFLPLPGLKQALLVAVEQDEEQTLKELSYIMAERPLQNSAAHGVLLEIAIHDLEGHDTIREIAQASQRLDEILPSDVELLDQRWITPLARLKDASAYAARYGSPLGRQARRDALEDMIDKLESVYPNTIFRDLKLSKRLSGIVDMWRNIARSEEQKLEQEFEKIGHIDRDRALARRKPRHFNGSG